MEKSSIDLGFLECVEQKWRLHRAYFPSKVGGKPAWLDPKSLPPGDSILCPSCKKTMIFLLQIYAPDDEKVHCFHRTIYIFCCKNGSCYEDPGNQVISILRCTLPRDNEFYDYDSPEYDSPIAATECKEFQTLCNVCGYTADKACSRCKRAHYCDKDHQVMDWKFHKKVCNKDLPVIDETLSCNYLFSEKEIVIESEERRHDTEDKDHAKSCLEDYKTALDAETPFSTEDLEEAVSAQKEDKTFLKFKQKTSHYPEQILRYDRGGKPLWCSSESSLSSDAVPSCECGAERQFEFQITPQLLSFLNLDSSVEGPAMDWGTVAVYTCSADCSPSVGQKRAYKTEFCWKQNYSQG